MNEFKSNKIVFLAYNVYGIGGTVRHIIDNSNYFINQGYDVHILSINRTFDKPTLGYNNRIHYHSIKESRKGKKKPFLQKIMNKIPSILCDKREDLYKEMSLYTDFMLLKFLMFYFKDCYIFATIPFFTKITSYLKRIRNYFIISQEHKGINFYSSGYERKVLEYYKKSNLIHCVNQVDYNILSNKFKKCIYIPNGIQSISSRTLYNNKIMVAAGRIEEQKNFIRALEIFNKSNSVKEGWMLLIYGKGSLKKDLEEFILKNNLYNNVIILPPTNQLDQELSKASLYLLTSKYESFGLVTLEALSHGLVVLSFETDGSKMLIENNKNGFIFKQNDEQGYIDCINKLITDKECLIELGNNAIKTAQKYLIVTQNKQWLSILKR